MQALSAQAAGELLVSSSSDADDEGTPDRGARPARAPPYTPIERKRKQKRAVHADAPAHGGGEMQAQGSAGMQAKEKPTEFLFALTRSTSAGGAEDRASSAGGGGALDGGYVMLPASQTRHVAGRPTTTCGWVKPSRRRMAVPNASFGSVSAGVVGRAYTNPAAPWVETDSSRATDVG